MWSGRLRTSFRHAKDHVGIRWAALGAREAKSQEVRQLYVLMVSLLKLLGLGRSPKLVDFDCNYYLTFLVRLGQVWGVVVEQGDPNTQRKI